MNLVESLLDVLALIGIILTGGFLVFFLGDLLLSVLDPSYGSIFKRKKKQQEDEKPEVKAAEPQNVVEPQKAAEPEVLPAKDEQPVAVNDDEEEEKITFNDFENLNDFDDEQALKEQQMLEGVQAFSRDDAMAELKAEEERFKQEQLAQALARQHENATEQTEENEKQEEEFDLDSIFVEDDENEDDQNNDDEDEDLADFNFDEEETPVEDQESVEETPVEEVSDTEENEVVEETPVEQSEDETEKTDDVAEEPAEEAVEEAAVEEEQQTEEVVEEAQPDEATLALMAEIEKLKAELEEARTAKPAEVEVKTVVNNMTEEECLAKLDELKARLKANEKEFKQAKKEYLPLKKIMKTLDNDKRKLRRKEAIVAKQKVVLYGVNNVVDIDQEKAQKLAEELDLLDGLRLSVQHCEEVIKSNEERIPLLEKNYNILLQENTNIKSDIANMEELLKTFQTVETSVTPVEENPQNDDSTENN